MREGLGSVGATCQVSKQSRREAADASTLGFFQQQQSKPKSNMHWRCCRRWQGRSQSGPRLVMVLVPPAGASTRSGLHSPVLDTRLFPPPTPPNAVATALEPTSPAVPSILPADQPAMLRAGLGCELTEPAHGGGKGYGLERWRSRGRLAPSHGERTRPREGSVAPQYARLRGPNQRHRFNTNNPVHQGVRECRKQTCGRLETSRRGWSTKQKQKGKEISFKNYNVKWIVVGHYSPVL